MLGAQKAPIFLSVAPAIMITVFTIGTADTFLAPFFGFINVACCQTDYNEQNCHDYKIFHKIIFLLSIYGCLFCGEATFRFKLFV